MADSAHSAKSADRRSWYEKFFNDSPYLAYLKHQHLVHLEDAVAFVKNKLELKEGQIVFDQCCGNAAVGACLAADGIKVYGCDIAPKMVEAAWENARSKGAAAEANANFVVADAKEYQCPEPADAAINWFTSFGYGDDDDNQMLLARVYESLKSGGRFALDYPNTAVVLGKFRKSMVQNIPTEGGDLLVTRESRVDARNGRLEQSWTFVEADGTRSSFDGSVRIYLPSDLCAMLEEAGFVGLELFGNTAGDWLSLESNRCIIIASKK
jgi:SAM-dependent methyltransferase